MEQSILLIMVLNLINNGIDPALGQSITLFEYEQKDCDTNCTHGLVAGVDKIRFTAQLNYSGDPQEANVQFYIKKIHTHGFALLRSYNIHDECKRKDKRTCYEVGKNLMNITLQESASRDLSEADLYATLVTPRRPEINSVIQRLPLIHELSDTRGKVEINGDYVTENDHCMTHIPGEELNIIYTCESQIQPCLIEMVFDDGNAHVTGLGKVEYNKKHTAYAQEGFTILHAPCRFGKKKKIIRCIISGPAERELPTDGHQWNSKLYIINISLSALTLTFLLYSILACIHLKRAKKKHKEKMILTENPSLILEEQNLVYQPNSKFKNNLTFESSERSSVTSHYRVNEPIKALEINQLLKERHEFSTHHSQLKSQVL